MRRAIGVVMVFLLAASAPAAAAPAGLPPIFTAIQAGAITARCPDARAAALHIALHEAVGTATAVAAEHDFLACADLLGAPREFEQRNYQVLAAAAAALLAARSSAGDPARQSYRDALRIVRTLMVRSDAVVYTPGTARTDDVTTLDSGQTLHQVTYRPTLSESHASTTSAYAPYAEWIADEARLALSAPHR